MGDSVARQSRGDGTARVVQAETQAHHPLHRADEQQLTRSTAREACRRVCGTAADSERTPRPERRGECHSLDATLWRDGVVVGTVRAPASLDPTETVPTNTTTRSVGLEVGDFDGDGRSRAPAATEPPTWTASGQPGFGPLVTLVALGGGLLLTRRWSA